MGERGYIGFRFEDSGETLYGRVDVEVAPDSSSLTIYGYAYNDVADQGLWAGTTEAVPEPSSLALLALGAAGIRALRRFNRPGV